MRASACCPDSWADRARSRFTSSLVGWNGLATTAPSASERVVRLAANPSHQLRPSWRIGAVELGEALERRVVVRGRGAQRHCSSAGRRVCGAACRVTPHASDLAGEAAVLGLAQKLVDVFAGDEIGYGCGGHGPLHSVEMSGVAVEDEDLKWPCAHREARRNPL